MIYWSDLPEGMDFKPLDPFTEDENRFESYPYHIVDRNLLMRVIADKLKFYGHKHGFKLDFLFYFYLYELYGNIEWKLSNDFAYKTAITWSAELYNYYLEEGCFPKGYYKRTLCYEIGV